MERNFKFYSVQPSRSAKLKLQYNYYYTTIDTATEITLSNKEKGEYTF